MKQSSLAQLETFQHINEYRLDVFQKDAFVVQAVRFRPTKEQAIELKNTIEQKGYKVWVYHIKDANRFRRLKNAEMITH